MVDKIWDTSFTAVIQYEWLFLLFLICFLQDSCFAERKSWDFKVIVQQKWNGHPLWCSYCVLSTCCHSALLVPLPCLAFLQAEVILVPVNLAVLLRPIGITAHWALLHSAFLDSDSEVLVHVRHWLVQNVVSFIPNKAQYFLSCVSLEVYRAPDVVINCCCIIQKPLIWISERLGVMPLYSVWTIMGPGMPIS